MGDHLEKEHGFHVIAHDHLGSIIRLGMPIEKLNILIRLSIRLCETDVRKSLHFSLYSELGTENCASM